MISDCWTAIAWRPRDGSVPLEWQAIRNAPVRPRQAKRMAERGVLFMANRHYEDRVELVVRVRTQKAGLT